MNLLKNIIYYLFFITISVTAQTKRIQFVSDETQLPLSDVEVYDGTLLIGKSDLNGYFDISTEDSNYLHTIKEEYKDYFIKVMDLHEKVILIKNKPILLYEVVIGKKENINIRKTLNHIKDYLSDYSKFEGQGNYKMPDYYILNNKLLIENDTLIYLNGLIDYRKWKEPRIGKNFRVVKRFKINPNHVDMVYYLNNKEMTFYSDWENGDYQYLDFLTTFCPLNSGYILTYNILERRWNYRYTIINIGNSYKVVFETKNKSPFGFSGYIIVDKKNYGILEFKAHLSDNSGNIGKSIMAQNKMVQTYHMTGIDYYAKCQENKDGIYQLISSYCNKQFEQIQGNFKGKKFTYSSKVEASDNYKDIEFVDFNIHTYNLR